MRYVRGLELALLALTRDCERVVIEPSGSDKPLAHWFEPFAKLELMGRKVNPQGRTEALRRL